MLKKPLNLIVFIALMGTSALALASQMIFQKGFFHWWAIILELGIIIVFAYYFILFLEQIFTWKEFKTNSQNPTKANLYSAMPIASALISLMLLNIGLPLLSDYTRSLAILFWQISAVFSLFLVVAVPINLKFRSKIQHIAGTWFLPPVGLFVLITAGSTLTLKTGYGKNFMELFNLLLLGPAFVLYFLTLTLIYYKSKIQEDMDKKLIPTFHIVLAPVAVSILALLSTAKLMSSSDIFPLNISISFHNISLIYSFVIYGYGLWVIAGLLTLYYRIVKEKLSIPFSELWWAFVFPTGAFTLATFNLHQSFPLPFFTWIYYPLYFVLLILWIYIILTLVNTQKNVS